MKILKEIVYDKYYNEEKFEITLTYGMRDDMRNHMLKLQIIHIEDRVTGKKKKIVLDDIIDITTIPNIYEGEKEGNNLDIINKDIDFRISSYLQSEAHKQKMVSLLKEIEEGE